MQTKPEQLKRQQEIMEHLGFYRHKCDGIWGPASIEAKKKWERDRSFIPGLPSNGLPLGDRDRMPNGVSYDKASRKLVYKSMEPKKDYTDDSLDSSSVTVATDSDAIVQSPNVDPQIAKSDNNGSSNDQATTVSDDQSLDQEDQFGSNDNEESEQQSSGEDDQQNRPHISNNENRHLHQGKKKKHR